MHPKELKSRLTIFWYIASFFLAVLVLKLAYVQFIQSDKYETLAKENRIRMVSIKAPRGEIYDRSGKILAQNKRVYTVSLSFLDIKNQKTIVKKLSDLMIKTYPDLTPEYINSLIEKQQFRLFEPVVVMRDIDWATVVRLEEHRQELPGVEIYTDSLRFYPEKMLAGHVLGYVHPIYDTTELAKENDSSNYKVGDLIGKDGIEKIYEKYLRGQDGARRVEVDVSGQPVRQLVTLQPKAGNNLVLTIDRDLQRVMEKSMDETMAGIQGELPKAKAGAAVLIDVKTGGILAMTSRPGLDPNVFTQRMDKETLKYYFPQGDYNPMNPGAATNRAIQSVYPPGSTFKVITGMAAIESGKLDPENFKVDCHGRYWIRPYIKDWQVHGVVGFYEALGVSCNTFFQEAGRRAGKDLIIKVAREFGLGSKTGIDLPYEKSGLLPTPSWKREINSVLIDEKYKEKREQLEKTYKDLIANAKDQDAKDDLIKERDRARKSLEAYYEIDYRFATTWQPYDTFNMSIGQGSNGYTIIQLANMVSTIANNGTRMQPYLVQKVVSPSGKTIKSFSPQVLGKVDLNPKDLEEIRKAMHYTASPGGTAYYIFKNIPPEISGGAKTGTAQTGRKGDIKNADFHGTFIAFAPADDPKIAYAGIIEYGYHGSTSSGLVARALFEQYFGITDYLADDKAPTADEEVKAE